MGWEKVTRRIKNRQEGASLALQPGLISLPGRSHGNSGAVLEPQQSESSKLLCCLSNRSKCPSVPAVSDFFLLFISQQHSSASLVNYLSWGSFPYLKKNVLMKKSKLTTEKLDNTKELSFYLYRKKLTTWYNIFLENIHAYTEIIFIQTETFIDPIL